jgi:hypothetical protein
MDDEKIYNAILDELREHGPRQGLWAKCFAEANGEENAAKALYFKYRAQQLVNQKSSVPVKSSSTDLTEPFTSNAPNAANNSRSSKIVLLLLAVAMGTFWWLSTFRDKKNELATKEIPITAASPQISASSNVKPEVEINIPEQKDLGKIQTPNKFEIKGTTIEKELSTKLHLFKYKIKTAKETYYSKDDINFYPIDYKYSNSLQEDETLVAKKEFVGDPTKNQLNIVLYNVQGSQGVVPPISYCFRSFELNAPKHINCFYGLDPRQDPKIKLIGNLIELTYTGYGPNDSLASGSIPVLKIFEYINGEMVCTGGNCEFKNFNHYEHLKQVLKIK